MTSPEDDPEDYTFFDPSKPFFTPEQLATGGHVSATERAWDAERERVAAELRLLEETWGAS